MIGGIASPETVFGGMSPLRDASMTWMTFMGLTGNQSDTYKSASDFARAPADEAWVYSCVKRLYTSAQQAPLRVYVRDGENLLPWQAVSPNDMAAADLDYLLSWVNPAEMGGHDLIAYNMAAYAVWGEWFVQKVRGRLGGPPQELYWLEASAMTPDPAQGRSVTTWHYQPPGAQAMDLLRKDVVQGKSVNLRDPRRGLSPISAISNEVSVSRQASIHTASTMANWNIPAGAWIAPKDLSLGPQDQSAIRRALRALRGPANAGKTPILPGGLDWKPLAMTPRDAEWVSARKLSRMAISAALGVPLVLAGDDEKTTVYANLRDAERIFWRNTMFPWFDWYADVLNQWLVPEFDPTGRRLAVAFDYAKIQADLLPFTEQAAIWNSWVDRQVVVPNEIRAHFRLGAPVAWGDDPVFPTKITAKADAGVVESAALVAAEDPTAAAPTAQEPDEPNDSAAGVDDAVTVRAFGRTLYRQAPVRRWIADPARSLDTFGLLGRSATPTTRAAIELGLRRRESADQIAARLEGVTP